jgi:precorrin-3B synthase
MVARVVTAQADRCPGVLHAVVARDGLLLRVRVPGGALDAAQLHGLADAAERYADGALDLTARAGVQLRGVAAGALESLAADLARLGLLPSPAHDRVRNVIASPFAGCDPGELLDARPVVRELDRLLLADPVFAELPVKFAFSIDGGGYPFPHGRADIALVAVMHDGAAAFALRIGGEPTGFAVAPEHGAEALIAGARAVLPHVDRTLASPWRLDWSAGARGSVLAAIAPYGFRTGGDAPRAAGDAIPLGVLAGAHPDRVALAPSIPLGRLRADQAHALAGLGAHAGSPLRLTPWRTIVIVDVPRAALGNARDTLAAAGLVLDASDGYHGVAACAGSYGCTAALADVRGHAAQLARRLASRETPGRRVNLAGCAKRCAMRRGAAVDLVAAEDGYVVLLDGLETHHGLGAVDAIERAVAAASSLRSLETP